MLLQRRMQQCLERSQKSRLSRQSDVQTSATHLASLNHSREAVNNRYMSDKAAALVLGQQQMQSARIQPNRPCIRRKPKYNRTQRVSIDLQDDPDSHVSSQQLKFGTNKFKYDYPNIRSQDLNNNYQL